MEKIEEESPNRVIYVASPRRWLGLSILFLMQCFNNLMTMMMPIMNNLQAAYNLKSPMLVVLTVIVWNVQAIPMNGVSMWLYNNYAYSKILTLASIL